MAKASPNSTLDPDLTEIATATHEVLCSAQPANYAGIAAVALADAALTPGDGNDFTIADGDTSGRKVTIAAKSGVSITASGSATHVVLHDGVDLIYVTTCATQALVSGGTVDIGAWKVEIGDPT